MAADLSERMALLELRMQLIEIDIKEIEGKLDQLLELRSKGLGAFWLVSIIFGSGLVAFVTMLINWAKG